MYSVVRRWAIFVATATAVLSAGCGLLPGALGGGSQHSPQAFAACMRSHGIPDFPDPQGGGFMQSGSPTRTTVNGVTLKESQAQITAGQRACQKYMGTPTTDGPASPQQEQAALAYAQCMRSHGVPNFPDPKVTAHSFTVHLAPGMDPHSPQFQAARNACQTLMPSPLRGGNSR